MNLFTATAQLTRASLVLYAGCHRHLTASLVFPDIDYLDNDRKVQALYTDPAALSYVDQHKQYVGDARLRFTLADYTKPPSSKIQKESYDLLISLSAGLVSPHCSKYVRQSGYLLASDAHSDARHAYLSPDWHLIAVWDNVRSNWLQDSTTLNRCFKVKGTGKPLTQEQADESARVGTVSKRSFRLEYEPMFFLFQKQQQQQVIVSKAVANRGTKRPASQLCK